MANFQIALHYSETYYQSKTPGYWGFWGIDHTDLLSNFTCSISWAFCELNSNHEPPGLLLPFISPHQIIIMFKTSLSTLRRKFIKLQWHYSIISLKRHGINRTGILFFLSLKRHWNMAHQKSDKTPSTSIIYLGIKQGSLCGNKKDWSNIMEPTLYWGLYHKKQKYLRVSNCL